jgi:hypothetical protein
VHAARIATTRGLIDALLELKHPHLGLSPSLGVPSIHRFPDRVHSFCTLSHTSIIQAIVSASAYPVAFPQAFASQTIPLPGSIRLTPTPRLWRAPVRFTVPELRLALHLGSHYSPGYFWNASRIRTKAVRPFTVSILDPADNPRRLVPTNDDSDVSSSPIHMQLCSTGFLVGFEVTAFHSRFTD